MDFGLWLDYYMFNQYENVVNFEVYIWMMGFEIWCQMDGKVIYFVVGFGICGMIIGNGCFLKLKNFDVQVIGVYFGEGYDIFGVCLFCQFEMIKFFLLDEYDVFIEIGDEEVWDMMLCFNCEESLIVGLSFVMVFVGVFKVVEDDFDVVVVVIFFDNVFKYVLNFECYFLEL